MRIDELKSGDAIVVDGDSWVSDVIDNITACRWTHIAMYVDGVVYEMDWPRCRGTPVAEWVRKNSRYILGVAPLLSPLDAAEETACETWWVSRIGLGYDWGLLLALAPATKWQRLCLALGLDKLARIQPAAGNGVCSTNVAWAWQAAGLPVVETTGASPRDCIEEAFVGTVQFLEV